MAMLIWNKKDFKEKGGNSVAEELAEMRRLFTKSLVPVRPLAVGTVLDADMLTLKKPGTGIPEAELPKLLGRRLKREVSPDRLLVWDDLNAQ
ncbi:MAG: hypothetical protein IID40_04205 [Planctomycetes bacterium]|nr:hypothetical protein [Planctomycetota bacterium]